MDGGGVPTSQEYKMEGVPVNSILWRRRAATCRMGVLLTRVE